MTDAAAEIPPPVDLDTQIADSRTTLKDQFFIVYEKCVRNIYYIITYDDLEDLSDTLNEIGTEGWIKEWLEKDSQGPRTERHKAQKMQECFEKICAENYKNFNMMYRADGLFTREWDLISTALKTYLNVLNQKIKVTGTWTNYLKWKLTGTGQHVSVELLLLQLKNINETDDSEIPMNHS